MPILVDPTPPVTPGDTPGRLLDDALAATLGSANFGLVDGHGVRVHLASLKGWFDPPSSTGSVEQRAADHGGWLSPAYAAPRVIDLLLRLRGSSWGHLDQTLDEIIAAVPLSSLDTLTVANGQQILQAAVRQGGDVLVSRYGAGAEVSISLIAPDPRRYGIELVQAQTGLPQVTGGLSLPISLPLTVGATVVSGTLSVVNDGNMPTRPTLSVVGPCPPGTITLRNTGQTLTFPVAISAGRTLVIDTDRRQALLDGISPQLVTGTWFEYAPGRNQAAFSANSYNAAARLVSEHRSAWR